MSATDIVLTAAGAAGGDVNYIDDCFATHLYTGNSSTQTITNGIDLAGKGGLVWVKQRGPAGNNHQLADTVRGASSQLASNTTAAATSETNRFTSFNSDGFSLDSGTIVNNSTQTYCSWTFREQAKFFDVVTYTGNGSTSGQSISHNLGSTPGMIIVKTTSGTGNWKVYHRLGGGSTSGVGSLNLTDAFDTPSTSWFPSVTSTTFSVSDNGSGVNNNGNTYVAYLFAHNAGGFGTAGTDNVISCGSGYAPSGNGQFVNLGYEPQLILIKATDQTSAWLIHDNMRGNTALQAQSSAAEINFGSGGLANGIVEFSATGFRLGDGYFGSSNTNYIYMAIRRPMKPPTSGTEVFSPAIFTGNNSTTTGQFITAGFTVDLAMQGFRNQPFGTAQTADRLRGFTGAGPCPRLLTYNTNAEGNSYDLFGGDSNVGIKNYGHDPSYTMVNWLFRRATGFMDVVCYTGTGSARTVAHNLGAVPELYILKCRNSTEATNWVVAGTSLSSSTADYLYLNTAGAINTTASIWQAPTSTTIGIGTAFPNDKNLNQSGLNYVAYLFASVAGVSKVGSYTGNGSSQTINCGFTAGARFVLIKRTDSTGDWVTLDTARGIVSGNDPFLQLNSSAAEVTGEDIVDPANSGFIVNETTEAINTNAATYIFLAIA